MSRRALVVGAGPNGLAAAITLAESGRQVLVLEAAPAPGGAVATEELTLPGFRHDTFSAVHPAAVASPVFAAMPLERHGLRWLHPEACYAHPLPDGRAPALYRDLDRTAASLDAAAPGAGDSWRRFAAPYVDRFEAMRAALLASFPPVRPAAALVGALGPRRAVELARFGLRPAEVLGRELFADAGARAWLYGSAMHGDVPVTARGSAIPALFLNLLGHGVGWPSPEGGAGRLTDALVGYLESLGGSVRTRADVVEIAASRGRVDGVRLASGEPVAGEIVIADVMPAALAALAGPTLATRYSRALRRYRPGPATLKLDWALDGPIPWTAPEARRAGTVHLGGDEDQLLRSAWHEGPPPERPYMLLGQQSIADPTRAPDGKHTAWGYIRGPQSADWASVRDRLVESMEAQVERFAPGFRDLILARHVLAPADLQRRNANLIGGDVGGGSYRLGQVVFRPVARPVPYSTPVRGLYIASAATFPGGAVHGVAGRAAATLAIRRAGR
ncbi:MAG TPA: NAD(P)/FAD-dependent oxidoreductase [Solirubrobacteraceae bacterium]